MGWGLAGTGNSSIAVERDMLSLRNGMGSGWDGKFFRRRRRRRRRRRPPAPNVCFLGNGFLRERVEYERSRRDTTAILMVRTLCIFLDVPKMGSFWGEG